jgi:diketogulonate reductase-like aldo/keto reductase
MEKLYANSQIRAIGVSNFLPEHLDTLLPAAEVVPAVNQFEIHPTFQQQELAARCRELGIAVEAYSPLGQGADLNAAAVKALAGKYGATPAQVVLAWHLAQGTIVIPKSADSNRMRENLGAVAVGLSPEELIEITALESGARAGADPAVAAFSQM